MALFDITKPTMPRAFQVLDGMNRGQILVGNPKHAADSIWQRSKGYFLHKS
jgi:hypothetical protein